MIHIVYLLFIMASPIPYKYLTILCNLSDIVSLLSHCMDGSLKYITCQWFNKYIDSTQMGRGPE